MAAKGPGDLPVPDLRTMEELCQPSLNGRGGPIALIAIQATNFGLKNDMIQQVQNSCQFHGLPGDDANKHLNKFLHVTQSIKVNGVADDALRLYHFPYSLTHHATAWFDRLPRNSINIFEQMAKMFLEIAALKAEMAEINKNLMRVLQVNQKVKAVTSSCETCGGPHSFNDCPATVGNTQNVYAAGAYQERETEATKDTVHPTNNESTKDVQPPVVLTESLIFNSKPVISPIIEPVTSPVRIMLKPINNHSKSGNIKHEIESLHQKPDQRAFFYKNQANEAKCQKIKSLRTILANSAKSKSKEK
nr:reverse transcriptase domain-containing protein [Tanacetum cinerariifolium]